MSKMVEKTLGEVKSILKFVNHSVQIAVTVSDDKITADAKGKKIVPRGTIVAGIGGSVLGDDTKLVAKANTKDAEGILYDDVDVTYGPNSGAMVIHGFVKTGALPEAPIAEAIAALKQITFVK